MWAWSCCAVPGAAGLDGVAEAILPWRIRELRRAAEKFTRYFMFKLVFCAKPLFNPITGNDRPVEDGKARPLGSQ
jgi:hypothetical protein